jgi:WD40 repeat protein
VADMLGEKGEQWLMNMATSGNSERFREEMNDKIKGRIQQQVAFECVQKWVEARRQEVITTSFTSNNNDLINSMFGKKSRFAYVDVLKGHTKEVYSVRFSPDGKTIASGSHDKTVRVWDVESGQEMRKLKGHSSSVWPASFSPNGKSVVSGSADWTVRIWDVESGKAVRTLKGHSDGVSSVCFSPDGRTVVSGSWDKTVRIWDVESGKEVLKLEGHSDGVYSVSFSPSGNTIVSGSADTTVRLWEV